MYNCGAAAREALIKSARAGSERFCSQARFEKRWNTVCTRKGYATSVSQPRWQRLCYISRFPNRRLGAKDPLSSRRRFIQRFHKVTVSQEGRKGNRPEPAKRAGISPCSFRVYLKTVNTPKQRVFSTCWAPFFLQYAEYSCKKMASSGGKSLAVGHIPGFQIDPNFGQARPTPIRKLRCKAGSRCPSGQSALRGCPAR